MNPGLVAARDGQFDSHALNGRGEFVGIGAHDLEIIEGAALRGVGGRMRGIGAPFDEEGEQTVMSVGEVDGFPVEDFSIGAGARTGRGAFKATPASRSFLAKASRSPG